MWGVLLVSFGGNFEISSFLVYWPWLVSIHLKFHCIGTFDSNHMCLNPRREITALDMGTVTVVFWLTMQSRVDFKLPPQFFWSLANGNGRTSGRHAMIFGFILYASYIRYAYCKAIVNNM